MHRRIRQHDHLRPRRRRRLARGLRVGVRLVQSAIAMAVAMAALLTVVALVASVRPVPLGSVVSALVAGHLDQRLAARSLAVQLGGLEVSFRSALVPVISARDIELRRLGSTAPLVTLSDAEIVLHRGSLALGRLAPKALRLTGLSVSAVSEGAALALDLGQAPVIPAVKTPGELIAALQRIFEQPGLAQIEEIGLAGIALRLEDRANGWVWHSRSGDLRISRSQQRLQVDLALSDLGDGDVPGSLSARLAGRSVPGQRRVALGRAGVEPGPAAAQRGGAHRCGGKQHGCAGVF